MMKTLTDWQPKRGEMVDASDDGNYWFEKVKYYEKCDEFYLVKFPENEIPDCVKFIRPIEQPTTLKIEDAKKAYVKALGLEGKKIDWV